MGADKRGSRLALALAGTALSPPVAGLTFAPAGVFSMSRPGAGGEAAAIRSLCEEYELDFVFVSASAPWAADLAENDRDFAVMWVVEGPLWRVLSAVDPEKGLRSTLRDPESLREPLRVETDRAAHLLEGGIALGVEALVVADDLAGSQGLLVPADYAYEEVFPLFGDLVRVSASAGKPAILHSDGCIESLLPAVRDAGFSAVHAGGGLARDEFERVYWAARRLGLALIGGVGTASLGRGEAAAVRAGTRAALLAHSGGLLVSDDGGITTEKEMAAFGAALGAVRGKPAATA